jgi:FKBP12-rapamycin complex-associated protein
MLAIAVGPALSKYMHDLLDCMFAVGLTDALRNALSDLARHIPPLLSTIQERLLDVLSLVLFNRPYTHPGAPGRRGLLLAASAAAALVARDSESRDEEMMILALNTLGTFEFRGKSGAF